MNIGQLAVLSVVTLGTVIVAVAAWFVAGRLVAWTEMPSYGTDQTRVPHTLTRFRNFRGRTHGMKAILAFVAVSVGGLLVVLLLMWGFGRLTLLATVTRIDHPIITYFSDHRMPWLTTILEVVTVIGNRRLTYGLAIVVGLWLLVVKRWWIARSSWSGPGTPSYRYRWN